MPIREIISASEDEILVKFNTSKSGLSSSYAKDLLKIYGKNEIEKKKRRAAIIEFILKIKNPLILILIFAAIISGFLGEVTNALIIIIIVLISAILEFVQEYKAENAVEKLIKRVEISVEVLRDGKKQEIKSSELVPGDIILLSAGDIIPADIRVIEAKDFFVDQSAITGESFPVEKFSKKINENNIDKTSMKNYLFMGTSVISGYATGVVVKTGKFTEYGQIIKYATENKLETEFEREIKKIGYMTMQITLFLVLFIFFVNSLLKQNFLNSFLFAVAIAVGIIPELLPVIVSLNLSRGAIEMAKKDVIIKRLESIHNFGSMDVLCCDKTGTLTENKIKMIMHIDINGKNNEKVFLYSYINSYNQTGIKNPLDEAILNHENINVTNYKKIDEIPFDFLRKRVSIIVERNNSYILITKGAPEEINKICLYYEDLGSVKKITEEIKDKIKNKFNELSAQGYRVLSIAYKKDIEKKNTYSKEDENNLIFLGFIAFLDPPKESTKESIRKLQNSGIEIKILTGDNDLITKKICEDLNFKVKGIILGSEIDNLTDDVLAKAVEENNVFARVSPIQKNRIINMLKRNGHVVGFLGDGINDVPSMKVADVSISVDNAVEIAKDTADIILIRKDLTILHNGIVEGRKTFGNTMKYILMSFSSNFGNMISASLASLFLKFLPMLPIQILLNNLIYDFSEATIPYDNVDKEYLQKPKKINIKFIKRFMIIFGSISSIFDILTFCVLIFIFNASESLFQTAWFVESLCTQALVIFVIRTKKVPFIKSKPNILLTLTTLGVVILALIIPYTILSLYFRFVELPFVFLEILFIFIISYLLIVEVVKIWFYKKYNE
ncbi:MAG: magnesium-translocating P-type ATPase [Candidatus Aenigmarchaeota archaeon]|nr:magnesium-translocating P-type ATPase [Candidatus Aenigmarchaeota archaeon]